MGVVNTHISSNFLIMYCPNCEQLNNCGCKNCNGIENTLIIDYENKGYQCCFCGHKFNEQDSLDWEWDRMHSKFKMEISKKMCIEWKESDSTERKKLENAFGTYGYESAFTQHFGIRPEKCGYKELKQIKRNMNIDIILVNK